MQRYIIFSARDNSSWIERDIIFHPCLSILLEPFKTSYISYMKRKLVVVHSCPPSEAVLGDVQAEFPGMSQLPTVSLVGLVAVLGRKHGVDEIGRLVEHDLVHHQYRVILCKLWQYQPLVCPSVAIST